MNTSVDLHENREIIPVMSTANPSAPTSPTDLPAWAVPVEDLEAMLDTDDESVDTAVIPRLAFREAVEESAATATTAVTTVDVTDQPAPAAEPTAPPVGHSLRSRHASPESVAAIRRNLIALASVVVSIVILGAASAWFAGWIALAGYAVLVITAAVALRRVNSRYAPRHSRYTPRHA